MNYPLSLSSPQFAPVIRILLLAALVPGLSRAADSPDPADATLRDSGRSFTVSLEQLGYNGRVLDQDSEATYTFYFPVPRDVSIGGAVLRLHYRTSPLLKTPSNLRVFLGASPRAVISLARQLSAAPGAEPGGAVTAEDHWATISLPGADVKGAFLAIRTDVSTAISQDVCQDERAKAAFVELLPDSGIAYSIASVAPGSIRAAWDLLPRHVKVTISPGTLSPDAFLAAWKLSTRLIGTGRTVEIVRLPERGDIAVARRQELEEAFPRAAGAAAPSGNVILYPAAGGPFLALTDSFRNGLTLLSGDWIGLASDAGYDTMPERQTPFNDRHIQLNLHALGVSDALRETWGTAEWSIAIGPQAVPASYRPQAVSIQLATAPAPDDHPSMLSTFWNGNLVEVERVPGDGRPHHFLVPLPQSGQRAFNKLRIVLERDQQRSRCGEGYGGMLIASQLLESTAVICERHEVRPLTLSELSDLLRSGYSVYLPKEEMDHPEPALAFLSRLTQDMGAFPEAAQIFSYVPGQEIRPDRPFILIGARSVRGPNGPVAFDRGRVLVTDSRGSTLLDVEELADISVAQLAHAGAQPGLWIAPGKHGLPSALSYDFSDGDVAFLANSGTVRLLDSRKVDVSRVAYPDFRDWQQLLFEYRFWLFALLWALLTVGFVQLYRRTIGRQNYGKKTA
jgi:hypothetical protein